jgi:NAD(P)H-dependent FMN reductase
MKVLVIFGSPRKKNSYFVTKALETELKKLGEVEFEYLFLKDIDLATCIGCHNCLFFGESKCPLPDNVNNVLEKMLTSNGLIFVSPVYVSHVTGLMKNFIDRFSFLCHRPQLFRQDLLVISTTGIMGLKDVLNYMESVSQTWGARSVTKLGIVTPPDKTAEEITNDPQIRQAALRFYKKLNKAAWSPSLKQVIQFQAQKTFLTSAQASKFSPKDYEHYKKLQDKSFNVPAKITLWKRVIGKIVSLIVKLSSKG